ncbi:MAG: hypothetical protein NWF05_11645 [Candidatus Bathyarchaeota archaeon]|nr:hypothetical protein [Candidatus Bathyarchaeota archaeon]
MNAAHSQAAKDRFTPCAFGVALILVGLAVCLLGAGSLEQIAEHGVLNAPVLVLAAFAVLGGVFIAGSLLQK